MVHGPGDHGVWDHGHEDHDLGYHGDGDPDNQIIRKFIQTYLVSNCCDC